MSNIHEMDKRIPLSLDIETSGLNPDLHKVLSIGAANSEISFNIDIRYDDIIPFTNEAYGVNRISRDSLKDENRVLLPEAIKKLEEILVDENYLLIGFNVGTFDYRFLEKHLTPTLIDKFGYRFFDLNTLFYTLAKMKGFEFRSLKESYMQGATDKIKENDKDVYKQGRHSAYFDALMCYYIYEELISENEL